MYISKIVSKQYIKYHSILICMYHHLEIKLENFSLPHHPHTIFLLILTCSCQYYQITTVKYVINTNCPQGKKLRTFKFVHLHASDTFYAPYFHYIIQTIGHVSIPKIHSFSPLCLFCVYDSSVLQNFYIFNHLLLNCSYYI